MGALRRHTVLILLVAYAFPIERELVLPHHVIGQSESVSLPEEIMPIEIGISIRIAERDIRQAVFVVHILLSRTCGIVRLIVPRVGIVESPTHTEPRAVFVAQCQVVTFGLYMTMIFVDAILQGSMFADTPLDEIFRIAVDECSLHIPPMLAGLPVVVQIQIV